MKVIVEGLEITLVDKIKKARRKNKEVVKVVIKMKKVGVRILKDNKQKTKGDLVLEEEKKYIPKNKKLRLEDQKLSQLHHDIPVVRHGDRCKDNKVSNKKLLVARRKLNRVSSMKCLSFIYQLVDLCKTLSNLL